MATSIRNYALTTNPILERDARELFNVISKHRKNDPLAASLYCVRALPLGRPGIIALARVKQSSFLSDEFLLLPHPRKRGCAIPLPNVFRDLDVSAIRDFLKVARDPSYFRFRLREMGYLTPAIFSWNRFARLVEAIQFDYGDNILLQVYNFRVSARWPDLCTNETETQAAKKEASSSPSPKRIRLKFQRVRRICLDYRKAIRRSSEVDGPLNFLFPDAAPKDLGLGEGDVYRIIRHIFEENNRDQVSPVSLCSYLRCALKILEADSSHRAISDTPPFRQAHRLIAKAVETLDIPIVEPPRWKKVPRENEQPLNLPTPRLLEQMIFRTRVPVTDIRAATASVGLHISLFTGRRSSDWADVRLGGFAGFLGVDELTIPTTKVKRVRNIRLPLLRLLPTDSLAYVREWHAHLIVRLSENTTLFELVTGEKRRVGSLKNNVRDRWVSSIQSATGLELTRLHQFRHAFATWALVAILLARHPHLAKMKPVAALIEGATFFSAAQLANWRELSRELEDPLNIVCRVLGHTSPHELIHSYAVAWPLLAQMRAELYLNPNEA